MRPRKNTTHSRKNTYNCRNSPTARYTRSTATYSTNSPRFNPIRNEVECRLGSYHNVYNQFTPGRKTYLSPSVANRWMRNVNNGVQVYKFNNKDFGRHFGNTWASANPTAVRKYLTTRYGSTIKDVTRGNNNTWLIATTRTPTKRPFTNYNWWK
jgi:hypothetical protein